MSLLSIASDATRALVAWWMRDASAAEPDPPPLRLVVRAVEAEVSIALVDPAGQVLFRESVDWANYRRDVFDRCRARAQGMAPPGALPVSLAIGQAVIRSLIVHPRDCAEAEALIRAQIGRTIPLRPDEVTLGCVFRPTAENRTEVATLAVPASLVERLLAALDLRADEIAILEKPAGDDGGGLLVPFCRSAPPSDRCAVS